MQVPPPDELIARLRALPPAGPLLARLGDDPTVYLVGGAVRDLLRGGEPMELDLVVEGDAIALARRLGAAPVVHDRFGTSTVGLDGYTYDIARSRRETYSRPGALPDVAPAPLAEDLTRRDFTVNALAIALGGEQAGTLWAVSAALEDLDANVLRVMHERSFIDDPTRLLRLARYASRLRFTVEPHTLALARAATADGALATVSGARVGAELRLLAHEPDPVAAFETLHELGLDKAIEPNFGLERADVLRRALELLGPGGRPDLLTLAAASRRIPTGRLRELLDELAFEATERDAILAAASGADALAGSLARAERPSAIAAAVAGAGPELVALAGAHAPAQQAARAWLERLRHVRLEIDGRDLIAAGIPEGPAVGRGLRAALDAKLDGRAAGREAELRAALDGARARR